MAMTARSSTRTRTVGIDTREAPTPDAAQASVAVLTSRVLWDAITDSVAGYPSAVHKYLRVVVDGEDDEYSDDTESHQALEALELDESTKSFFDSDGLSQDGVVVHLAIAADDVRAFQIMCMLRKRFAHYRLDSYLDFSQAVRCAVLFNRIRILQCIDETEALGPEACTREPDLLALALHNAEHASVEVLDWIYTHVRREHNPLMRAHLQQCARQGRLDLVQWLYERGCKLSQKAVCGAAMYGHLSVLKYLYARTQARCKARAINRAAALGDLDLIKFLVANDTKYESQSAINSAAKSGHLAIVQFLVESKICQDTSRVIDYAAKSGNLALVQYLHALFPDSSCTPFAMDNAAAHNHLEVVQFLHEHRAEGCSAQALELPIRHGYLAIVEFLHEHYPHLEVPPHLLHVSAYSPIRHVVAFLHRHRTQGCAANPLTWAVRSGRLDVIAFLRKNFPRMELSPMAFDLAAANGHLSVVEYLHQNYSERCSSSALDWAVRQGHFAVVSFLREHYPHLEVSSAALHLAVSLGHFDVVTFLYARDPKLRRFMPAAFGFAAANGLISMVAYLLYTFPGSNVSDAFISAARRGHLNVVKFLREYCADDDVAVALRAADVCRRRDVVEYLRTRLPESSAQ